jgi:hypothetical protein
MEALDPLNLIRIIPAEGWLSRKIFDTPPKTGRDFFLMGSHLEINHP